MAAKTAPVQHKVNLGKAGTKLIRFDRDIFKKAEDAQKAVYPKGAPGPTMQDWLGFLVGLGAGVVMGGHKTPSRRVRAGSRG